MFHLTINGRPLCQHTGCVAGMADAEKAGVTQCEYANGADAWKAQQTWQRAHPAHDSQVADSPCPDMVEVTYEAEIRDCPHNDAEPDPKRQIRDFKAFVGGVHVASFIRTFSFRRGWWLRDAGGRAVVWNDWTPKHLGQLIDVKAQFDHAVRKSLAEGLLPSAAQIAERTAREARELADLQAAEQARVQRYQQAQVLTEAAIGGPDLPAPELVLDLANALAVLESFASGFEGDELQDGMDSMLAGARKALTTFKTAFPMYGVKGTLESTPAAVIAPTMHNADRAADLATILAALRFYQQKGQGDPAGRSDAIHDIATAGGDVISLDAEGIDSLCVSLNTGDLAVIETAPRATGYDSMAKGSPTGDTSDRPNKHGIAWVASWSSCGASASEPCRTYADAYAWITGRARRHGLTIPETAIPPKPDGYQGWRYETANGHRFGIRRAT